MKYVKRVLGLSVLCIMMLLTTACSGKEPVVTIGDYELKIGSSTPKDLVDAGFTNRYEKSNIGANTLEYFYAEKGDLYYGQIAVGNESSSQIEFEKGRIFSISFHYDEGENMGDILVDGVNYKGYTRDQIKEAMKDQTPDLDSDKYLTYKISGNEYTFKFDNGSETVTYISIDDGTEVEYK